MMALDGELEPQMFLPNIGGLLFKSEVFNSVLTVAGCFNSIKAHIRNIYNSSEAMTVKTTQSETLTPS